MKFFARVMKTTSKDIILLDFTALRSLVMCTLIVNSFDLSELFKTFSKRLALKNSEYEINLEWKELFMTFLDVTLLPSMRGYSSEIVINFFPLNNYSGVCKDIFSLTLFGFEPATPWAWREIPTTVLRHNGLWLRNQWITWYILILLCFN